MAGRRKENDREELKLRVVETASKSFMTLGIKAVHMDDIASSLSISKRTLLNCLEIKKNFCWKFSVFIVIV